MSNSKPLRPEAPRTILLATDMSSRCDRALDRACALAETWNARLILASSIEPQTAGPSWRRHARDPVVRLRFEGAEAIADRPVSWDVEVLEGPAETVVADAARRLGADLIVVGMARNELLGRMTPGRTVESLMRHAPAPLLVVKRRARQPYSRIVVPTDFSLAAELALAHAAILFPDADFTLLHGYRTPFAGFLEPGECDDELGEIAKGEQAAFIARVRARAGEVVRLSGLVEAGDAEALVSDYVQARSPQLMVLGAHSHAGPLARWAPNMAARLLMAAECDVLVAPELAEGGLFAPSLNAGRR